MSKPIKVDFFNCALGRLHFILFLLRSSSFFYFFKRLSSIFIYFEVVFHFYLFLGRLPFFLGRLPFLFRSSSIIFQVFILFFQTKIKVKIRLHTENQLPRLSGSALKVPVWWWVGSYPLLSQAPTPVEVELGCDNDLFHNLIVPVQISFRNSSHSRSKYFTTKKSLSALLAW